MITYSGVRIEPTDKFGGQFSGVPSLTDIVLGLGRAARFAGQTTRWWPVLLHSLVCAEIAKRMGMHNRMQFYCLMHDAHESVTSDVPAFFKPAELKNQQELIDDRLYTSLGIEHPSLFHRMAIGVVDDMALRAEAFVYGPPAIMAHLSPPAIGDVRIVEKIGAQFPGASDTDGLESPGAVAFLRVFKELYPHAVTVQRNDSPQQESKSNGTPCH
jgi:hypothetical protein